MTDIRATLTAKLAELDEEMAAMAKKPTEQGSISFGKRIGEGTSMAVDRLAQVAVHDQYQVTRADVVRALEKLDEDTYGSCDVCGRPIAEGRLEALPWAVLCVEDAAAASPAEIGEHADSSGKSGMLWPILGTLRVSRAGRPGEPKTQEDSWHCEAL